MGSEPRLSYTIWFSQRTGSTWFADLLESTGVAGRPREHLNFASAEEAAGHYGATSGAELVDAVRAAGTGADRVFAIKHSFHQPGFDHVLDGLRPGWREEFGESGRLAAWESAFPHHRHIVMTRRNKVRQAVSWWRAIQSGEWHRQHRPLAVPVGPDEAHDVDSHAVDSHAVDSYDFDAIDHLVSEATLREAGIAELLAGGRARALTLVYEDLCLDPQLALTHTLAYLGLTAPRGGESAFAAIADEVSDDWVQRYRERKQQGWANRGW